MTVNGELNVSSHFKIHGLDVKKSRIKHVAVFNGGKKRPAKEK